jgi:hypothetical protein
MLAALARQLRATLLTMDKDFDAVSGITTENWLLPRVGATAEIRAAPGWVAHACGGISSIAQNTKSVGGCSTPSRLSLDEIWPRW